jgi:hypothetical protein
MCGKNNPAEAEKCQYCQARLRPLGSKPASDAAVPNPAQPASQPPAGEDDTGWLRGLLGSDSTPEAESESEGQPHQEAGEDDADWLERIRQRTQEEQDAVSKIGPKPKLDTIHPQEPESSATASELENWLKSLEQSEEAQPPSSSTPPPSSQVPPPAAPVQNNSEDDDEWLRSLTARIEASQSMEDQMQTLRGSREDEPEQPPAKPADTGDLPDWLQNFRSGESGQNVPTQPGAGKPPAEETAGWLKDFEQAGKDSQDISADELPDWAKNPSDQGGEMKAPQAGAGDEIPDWLRDLKQEPPAAEAPPEPTAPSEELPDWLTAGAQSQPAAQESAGGDELPDWLKNFNMEQPGVENPTPGPGEPPAPSEELPDWLKELQPVEETPSQPAPAESLPDWMKEATPPAEEESATPVPSVSEPEAEMPDWLKDIGPLPTEAGETPSELTIEAQPAAETPAEPAAEAQPAAETPAEPATEAQPAAETPDWLKDLGPLPAEAGETPAEPAAEAQPAAETPAEPAAEAQPAAETPDWLKDFSTLPGAEGEQASSAESVSSWLDNLEEPETSAAQAGAPAQDEAAPAENIPEWLQAIKSGSQPEEEPVSSFGAQGLPEWMNNPQEIEGKWDEQPAPLEEAAPESVSPFASSEMDAMLAGVAPPENEAEPTVEEGEAEPLEPAQLPSWLQAMRPVESAVSDIPATVAADEQRIEKAGPLAGLRGVLPGEELASNYRKPPAYTNKLQVSEKQHLHANLLESILADETRVQPLPGERLQASQTIIRLLVAALLVFLVYVPVLTGFNLAVPAGLSASQPGVAEVFQSISELAPGANILLAADYEAGLSGEITTAALPVLKYLQTRQPNVIIGSTVPAGPVLGEMLLSQASITPIASFGYIAGGTHAVKLIGAHATTEQPAPLQQIIPFPYGQGWTDAGLQGIKDITGFQRILVLTDNLENARAWVEQVQPGLGPQTQILIITSAQVAPLVRTYVESGQVGGVVSGLAGGTAFEQLSQQSGPGSASWTAYQLTMGAVILLVIAGALATGISALLQPEKSKRKV